MECEDHRAHIKRLEEEVAHLQKELTRVEAARAADREEFREAYREVEVLTMHVAGWKEDFRDAIGSVTRGVQSVVASVTRRPGANAVRRHLAIAIADELRCVREFAASAMRDFEEALRARAQSWAGDSVDRACEADLVRSLHRAVLDVCDSCTRNKLHRKSEYTVTAPMSWNTTSLFEAVPFAVSALKTASEHMRQIQHASEILVLRAASLEADCASKLADAAALKATVANFISQVEREHITTKSLCFGSESKIANLTVDAPSSAFETALRDILEVRFTERLIADQSLRSRPAPPPHPAKIIEVVRPADAAPTSNIGGTAVLRKANVRLRFRLAVRQVICELLKFRCRRALSVSNVTYRSLRMRFREKEAEVHKLTRRLNSSAPHPWPPVVDMQLRPSALDLAQCWKASSLRPQAPAAPSAPSPHKSDFRQYVHELQRGIVPTEPRRALIVSAPPAEQTGRLKR